MSTRDLLYCLQYNDSQYYHPVSKLNNDPSYTYAFRLAEKKCGLKGVYFIKNQNDKLNQNWAGIPLVFICEANSEDDAHRLHKLVWNQNVVPFLLVSTPKSYRLYPGFQYDTAPGSKKDQYLDIALSAKDVLSKFSAFKAQSIDSGAVWKTWGGVVKQNTRVDTRLLNNLQTLSKWLQSNGLGRFVSHALIGKYVYLHYLRDRNILSDRKLAQWDIHKDLIFGRNATVSGFFEVTKRLDNWLNGTLFPISNEDLNSPGEIHIRQVAATFSGDDIRTGQMHLDFKAYDFEHIPIETLSIVYQQFLHSEGRGRGQGAFYTPIHLVNFVLNELDAKLTLRKKIKVLDPACGSGAFLVQCYRRLIETEMARKKNQLTPFELKKLLQNHIHGIDVDEDACGVAELSLTLTLLDYVDPPDLEKPNYRTFELPKLRDNNIFHCDGGFFKPSSAWQKAKPQGGYDWIVGNPPWKTVKTGSTDAGDKATISWMVKNDKKFPVTSKQIAEAFAWEASKHISKKGLIGLLLPAGTLFKKNGKRFRKHFFGSMDVWCVVNFSNLRHLLFIGAVNPTAAFFYKNKDPNKSETQRITTYSPFAIQQLSSYESNKKKKLWTVLVDADQIKEIATNEAASGNSLPWKIAMWGSHRDAYLISSLEKKFISLGQFINDNSLRMHSGLELRYVDPNADIKQEPVEFVPELKEKNELNLEHLAGHNRIFALPKAALVPIEPNRYYVRKGRVQKPLSICRPPHIFVHAARKFAIFSNKFFILPPRQIGISGGKKSSEQLKALALYLNSDFAVYHQFMTSSFWGVERDRPDKSDLERLPIPIGDLSAGKLKEWAQLYDALAAETIKRYSASDSILFTEDIIPNQFDDLFIQLNYEVNNALGIKNYEKWLIDDLLFIRKKLMEGRIAKTALHSPSISDLRNYGEVLKDELDAFFGLDANNHHRVKIHCSEHLSIIEIEHITSEKHSDVTVKNDLSDKETETLEGLKSELLSGNNQWIYYNKNLKIYQGRITYFVKPMRKLSWLKSQALIDADEFLAEKLVT